MQRRRPRLHLLPDYNRELASVRIGITFDLREDYLAEGFSEEETAEFDRPDTIEAICQALQDLGHQAEPIGNIRRLVEALAQGKRWDLVFNIAEGLYGFAREAQVPALLDAYAIPYTFSDPLVLSLALHKGMTKRVLRDLGIPTAQFAIVEADSDLARIDLPFPLFAKPVAEGTGKGINVASKLRTREELTSVCRRLFEEFQQPVLVETFLPGREFTVGILGTGEQAAAIGALEIVLQPGADEAVYSYRNKEECERLVEYRLVDEPAVDAAKEIALAAWKGLGCRDAGRVDLRQDSEGVPNLLEVNPLSGLHPEHSDLPILCTQLGISYRDLIGRIVDSAASRLRRRSGKMPRLLSNNDSR